MGNNKLLFGENSILSAKLGISDVKMYLGNTLVYEPITVIVAKFIKIRGDGETIISGSEPTEYFKKIVIDGVEQSKPISAFTFDTYGEHTIEYTLLTPHVISDYSFSKCSKMTSITIPNDVTSIGKETFYGCNGLTSIVIPNNVTSIGGGAFYICSSLTSCTIGSGVTSIGDVALSNCTSLTSVTVNAVTPPTLGKNAFANNAKGRLIYVPSSSVKKYQQDWFEYASDIVAIK